MCFDDLAGFKVGIDHQALREGFSVHHLALGDLTGSGATHSGFDLPYPGDQIGELAWEEAHPVVVPLHFFIQREVFFDNVGAECGGSDRHVDAAVVA